MQYQYMSMMYVHTYILLNLTTTKTTTKREEEEEYKKKDNKGMNVISFQDIRVTNSYHIQF